MTTIRHSFYYSATESYISLGLQIIITVVLSRLLTPTEAGIFAVAAIFTGFAVQFRNFGISDYIVQERDLTAEKIRAALTINLLISWSAAGALSLLAPLVASFYSEPGIANVLRVQAIGLILMPFGGILIGYFKRILNFRPVFIANVAGNVTSCTVAIVCAVYGQGYMSLAWSSLAGVIVNSIGIMLFKPSDFPFWPSLKGVGPVFNFGKYASAIMLFGQIGKGAPEIIIGRAEDMASVAFFGRSSGLIELFNRAVLQAVMPICLPYFSASHRASGSVKSSYLTVISYITVVGWPFIVIVGLLAYSVIHVIYGFQWLQSVPLAQILCFAFAIELIHIFSKEALTSMGEVKRSHQLQIGVQVSRVLGLLAVIPFGLREAAMGLVCASVFNFFYTQWHLKQALDLNLREVWQVSRKSLLISLLMGLPVVLVLQLFPQNESNYYWYGSLGGIFAILAWYSLLTAVRHPLVAELNSVGRQIFSRKSIDLPPGEPAAGEDSVQNALNGAGTGHRVTPELIRQLTRHFGVSKIQVLGPISVRPNSVIYRIDLDEAQGRRFAGKFYVRGGKIGDINLAPDFEAAQQQYSALSKVSAAMLHQDRFAVPHAVHFDGEYAISVMSWIEGESMPKVLEGLHASQDLASHFSEMGGWLGIFHTVGPYSHKVANASERLTSIGKMVAKPVPSRVFDKALKVLLTHLNDFEGLVVTNSWLHGDCKMENFMISQGKLYGIDFQLRHENACEYDAAQFWNNLDLLLYGPLLLRVGFRRAALKRSFWYGYTQFGQPINQPYFKWLRLSLFLSFWHAETMRNKTSPKTVVKKWIYRHLTKRLVSAFLKSVER